MDEQVYTLGQQRAYMECGCSADTIHSNAHDGLAAKHPSCIVHETCRVVAAPNLEGRKARCDYYGKKVKRGMYNANCCEKCAKVEVCQCEEPSATSLWFFQHHADKEYDGFYCACHGAD